jgi:hypothetical protein
MPFPSGIQVVRKPVKSRCFRTVSELAAKGRFPGRSRWSLAGKPPFRFSRCFPDIYRALLIWRDGFPFSKAGVVLSGLTPVDRVQADLLGLADQRRSARLMAAVDAVNTTLGRGGRMRQNNRSPAYTTRLSDAPVIRA